MGTGDKVIGYVRVSTQEQGADGAGSDAQRRAIRDECARRGWQLVSIEEDVKSGKTLSNRPGLERVLAACRAGEVSGVIVAKLDRLSRSLPDFARLLEDAKDRGYNVVALDLGVDLSTPAGEFLANVMASAAQWERRIIGQRTKDALAELKAQGVTLGRPTVIDAKLAARIRLQRRRGWTLQAICDQLNANGVPTAHGGATWRPTSLRAVLSPSKPL